MGTTLTGTTPQDTYDSLIKVTDNGPLSATAKYLSDGLGNDSVLALSTGNIGIGTTSPSRNLHILGGAGIGTVLKLEAGSGAVTYLQLAYNGATNAQSGYISYDSSANMGLFTNDTERMRITSAGNVGIGTSAPSYKLQADITDATAYSSANTLTASPVFWVNNNSTTAGTAATIRLDGGALGGNAAATISSVHVGSGSSALTFGTRNANSDITERVRILAGGGITFNGDTAAANALDDYEEGTFNFTLSFGGASTGITYAARGGTYTKIGRQVTVVGYIELSSKGSATGNAELQGLPFTIGAGAANYSSVTLSNVSNITFTNFPSLRADVGATKCTFLDTSSAGSLTALTDTNFANNSNFILSLTYFV